MVKRLFPKFLSYTHEMWNEELQRYRSLDPNHFHVFLAGCKYLTNIWLLILGCTASLLGRQNLSLKKYSEYTRHPRQTGTLNKIALVIWQIYIAVQCQKMKDPKLKGQQEQLAVNKRKVHGQTFWPISPLPQGGKAFQISAEKLN